MSERPFTRDLTTEILRFLQHRCQMSLATLNPELGFKFDAVLVGRDPLNVVIVETKASANHQNLKAIGRKIQSFAWSLYAQKKHNLVTLILVVPELPSADVIRKTLSDLNGSARVFVIPQWADQAQVETALNSLAAPAFALGHKEAVGFAQLEKLLEGLDASPILRMAESAPSENALKSQLVERFENLAAEVESALKKP